MQVMHISFITRNAHILEGRNKRPIVRVFFNFQFTLLAVGEAPEYVSNFTPSSVEPSRYKFYGIHGGMCDRDLEWGYCMREMDFSV